MAHVNGGTQTLHFGEHASYEIRCGMLHGRVGWHLWQWVCLARLRGAWQSVASRYVFMYDLYVHLRWYLYYQAENGRWEQ